MDFENFLTESFKLLNKKDINCFFKDAKDRLSVSQLEDMANAFECSNIDLAPFKDTIFLGFSDSLLIYPNSEIWESAISKELKKISISKKFKIPIRLKNFLSALDYSNYKNNTDFQLARGSKVEMFKGPIDTIEIYPGFTVASGGRLFVMEDVKIELKNTKKNSSLIVEDCKLEYIKDESNKEFMFVIPGFGVGYNKEGLESYIKSLLKYIIKLARYSKFKKF